MYFTHRNSIFEQVKCIKSNSKPFLRKSLGISNINAVLYQYKVSYLGSVIPVSSVIPL